MKNPILVLVALLFLPSISSGEPPKARPAAFQQCLVDAQSWLKSETSEKSQAYDGLRQGWIEQAAGQVSACSTKQCVTGVQRDIADHLQSVSALQAQVMNQISAEALARTTACFKIVAH